MTSLKTCNQDDISTKLHLEYDRSSREYCALAQKFLQDLEPIFASGITKDALYKFTQARIAQLNLYNVDPYDVFLEAITRAVVWITSHNESIAQPKAWLRVAIGHILCEEARKIKKVCQFPDSGFENIALVDDGESDDSYGSYTARAWQAFRRLSKPEKQIIIYKLFQSMSYQEISQLTHYKGQSLTALRKQYSRAIQKLRQVFLVLS